MSYLKVPQLSILLTCFGMLVFDNLIICRRRKIRCRVSDIFRVFVFLFISDADVVIGKSIFIMNFIFSWFGLLFAWP